MWNEEVHWSGRFHVCSVDSYWYLIWILYRKLDFNLLLLKVIYCQTRTDLYRGFLRHLKSLSDTCLKIFKNGKTQVPLFLHDVKTHDKNVSLCDNIPNRSQLFLLTLELSLISLKPVPPIIPMHENIVDILYYQWCTFQQFNDMWKCY